MCSQPLAGVGGVLALLLALSGCGGVTKTDVSGTVKVDGELVASGTITFLPEEGKGRPERSTIKDGRYTVHNVAVGPAKVAIKNPKILGKRRQFEDDPKSREIVITEETLPPRYSDFAMTELRYEVKSGPNDKDFDLKTK